MTSGSSAALTFDDEFSSLSLWNGTTGTWDTTAPYVALDGAGYSLPSNGEQEWYINSTYAPTASVQPWNVNNGVLTITAAPASAAIQSQIDGYQYTSGAINTYHSFSQTYGYFEMNAELPAGQGLWPAFWLLPESGAWPPEIDAMEVLGNNPNELYTTVHSTDGNGNEVNDGVGTSVANMSTGFHSYGVDWEPDFITWYFDGIAVFQAATPSDLNQPMYMIANLAVGGAWPGDVNSTTPMPAQMEIDYIRAYSGLPSFITANATPVLASDFTLPSDLQDVQLVATTSQTVTGNNLGDTIISNDAGSTIAGGTGNDTLVAGHGADVLTGGGGSDTFAFPFLPANAGTITDFNPASDKLDLSGVLNAVGYTGSNPVADGYLSFVSDGHGNTQVYVDSHNPADPGQTLVTTLEGVAPSSITAQDYVFTVDPSAGGTGSTTVSATPVDTSAASYTVPTNVENVVLTGTSAQTITANAIGDTITSNDYGSTLIGGSGNDTLIAGHGADVLTGGGGSDTFAFDYLPWNAGHITDFNTATDKLDLTGIFTAIGYTGSNPVADGYLTFQSDGSGDTQVYVNPHSASDPWPALVTTLEGISPSSITAANYVFSADAPASAPPSSAPPPVVSSTPVDITAANYTVPTDIDNVVLTGTLAQTVTANAVGDTIASNDYGSTIIGGTGNDTLIAGHGADTLTGGGGSDTFVFHYLPWNAGHVTDFNTATDKLDLTGIFTAIGYSGSNPVADGYLTFQSDGSGDTQVYVNSHDPSDPWPTLVTTLDHVASSSVTAANYVFSADPPVTVDSTPVDTAAANYTAPTNIDNIVLTGTAAQTVAGNNLGDTITSNDYGSTIVGGTGNDTLIAGHGADMLTGGGGSDTFVFNELPWNAGHVTDFNTATDKLDLSGIFSTIGYTGSDPIADGYLSFQSDGSGDTQVYVNSHDPSDPWPTLVTTLDHVSPSSITAEDYTITDAATASAPTLNATPVDTAAANYSVPANDDTVVLTGTAAQTVTGNNLGDTFTSNNYGSTITGGTGNDTFIAGQGADMLTGGGGNDSFVFNNLPWNAGHITDFNTASDTLNLSGIFSSIGYTGGNPVADGYLSFASDGAGDTKVYVNSQGPSTAMPILVTTLDHVAPSSVTAHDWIFHA